MRLAPDEPPMRRDPISLPNFALLLAAAWCLVALVLVAQNWAETARTFPDADDAMRLVEGHQDQEFRLAHREHANERTD